MNLSKQKIVIFGPIGDFGGRELESGFIASVLSTKYVVDICSSVLITKNSQVFDFNKKQKVIGIKELLFTHFIILKLVALLSYVKNRFKGNVNDYVNNAFAKHFLNYDKKVQIVLENLINDYDAVFIMAQLSSYLINDVILIAKKLNKKVFFRTTGTITFSGYDFIDSVDCFIHHSVNNANKIEKIKCHNYVIIDQCAYNEEALLKIPFVENNISNFLVLSRLSPEKGLEQIINFFIKIASENDILYFAGNGILEEELLTKCRNLNNIVFLGFVPNLELPVLLKKIECLIIPSSEESGPLVGIECMCAGKVVISTKVGAMPERLLGTFNQFWYKYDDFESFKNVFLEIKSINKINIKKTSEDVRNRYKDYYSINNISIQYLNVVNKSLNEKRRKSI